MRGLVLISLLLLWITPCLAAGSTDFHGRVTAVLDHQTLEITPTSGLPVRVRLKPGVSWLITRQDLSSAALNREVTISTATAQPDGMLLAFVLLPYDIPLIHVLEKATWDTPAARQYQQRAAEQQQVSAEMPAPSTPTPSTPQIQTPPPPPPEPPQLSPSPLLSCLPMMAEQSGASRDAPLISEAFKALRKVKAATEVGINMGDYGKLVVDAKAAVNEVTDQITDMGLKMEVETAMQAYADGLTVYNLFQKEKGDLLFIGESNPQAKQLNNMYRFMRERNGFVERQQALTAIWHVASIHLRCAQDLTK
jgi:hypothetical protein